MVVEFWNKIDQTDILIGLTKLPLHQFYLTYRNCVILKHLKKNKVLSVFILKVYNTLSLETVKHISFKTITF